MSVKTWQRRECFDARKCVLLAMCRRKEPGQMLGIATEVTALIKAPPYRLIFSADFEDSIWFFLL